MGLRLLRNTTGVDALQPGEYFVEHMKHTAKAVSVTLCCPTCGGISALTDDHSIARSGLVTPIWSCPCAPCAAWEWLDLGPEYGAKP